VIIGGLVVALVGVLPVDLKDLGAKLRDKDERARAEAIEGLGRDGSKEAFELVLGALKDPSSRVQDAVEKALPSWSEPALVAQLYGKKGLGDSDAWIQRHTLGALATASYTIDADALATALSSKEPRVRFAACHAVERIAVRAGFAGKTDKLSKMLDKLAKDPDEEVRAAALVGQARLTKRLPADAQALVETAPPAVACAALWLQATELGAPALPLLRSGLQRKERSVRAAAIDHLRMLATRDAALALVEAIKSETNPATLWRAADALEALSGVSFGDKIDLWQQWASNLPAAWTAQVESREGRKSSNDSTSKSGTAVLAGMPIVSTRVAILIDLSGSVWEKRADGTIPKDDLEQELARTLDGFTPETRFQLVPFTEDPAALSKGLTPATPQAVAKTKADFTGLKTSGKGDYWDAIEQTLADPEVDTIIVYGDGAPSGGRRWDLARMELDYLARNRFRRVELSAVLVGASKGLTERWTSWCVATGGEVKSVSKR